MEWVEILSATRSGFRLTEDDIENEDDTKLQWEID